MKTAQILLALLVSILTTTTWARGEVLKVFTETEAGGIWDASNEFYIRADLDGIGQFVHGAFKQTSDKNVFKGEITVNDASPKAVSYPATATLIYESKTLNALSPKKIFILKVDGFKKEFIIQK